MRSIATLILLYLITNSAIAQNTNHFRQINQDVWEAFYKAFDQLDHKYMVEIHDEDLIRIPAGQKIILDYQTYMDNYQKSFAAAKEENSTRSIELRFFERIANDSVASERGIYKLTIDKESLDERNFYGQFHVLLIKENGVWKILMDYDSNENNTIDETVFKEAYAMDDYNEFIRH
jgi:ketosteroid isomerase-like protein